MSSPVVSAFVVTLRDGLEAFLIVAVAIAFLRKVGNRRLVSAANWGIALSAVASVMAAMLYSRAMNQAAWQGTITLACAGSAAWFALQMWRVTRRMQRGDTSPRRLRLRGSISWIGVLLFSLLMIAREGMETMMLLGALIVQVGALDLTIAAAGGLALAATIAAIWSRFGHRVASRLFFQVTAIFLFVFVAQLTLSGLYQFGIAGVLAGGGVLQRVAGPFGPDGTYGRHLGDLLIGVPVGWLLAAIFLRHGKATARRFTDVAR